MMKDDFEIKDSIDFDNAGYYIDDYRTALKEEVTLEKDFSNVKKAKEQISLHDQAHLYDGVLSTNHVSQVLASDFFKFLMDTMY